MSPASSTKRFATSPRASSGAAPLLFVGRAEAPERRDQARAAVMMDFPFVGQEAWFRG